MTNRGHLIHYETWETYKIITLKVPQFSYSMSLFLQRIHNHTCFSPTERPNLAHIFQWLPEHLNFCTSVSGTRPAMINGPHLSRHHMACWLCPARQLCFRIMAALHSSPYHAMLVHLCDPPAVPLCQKGQQGRCRWKQSGRGRHCCTPVTRVCNRMAECSVSPTVISGGRTAVPPVCPCPCVRLRGTSGLRSSAD